jgi:hypothetical protein
MITSTLAIYVVSLSAGAVHDVSGLGQVVLLERRRERDRCIECGNPPNRCVEPLERLLTDLRGDLAGESTEARGLVDNKDAPRSLDALHDGACVERAKRPQIQNLQLRTILFGDA